MKSIADLLTSLRSYKLLLLVLIPVIVLLIPSRVSQLSVEPVWGLDKSSLELAFHRTDMKPSPSFMGHFTAGSRVVYYNANGTIKKADAVPPGSRTSAADRVMAYAVYENYGHIVRLRTSDGVERKIRSDSYPFMSKDGKYALFITGEAEGIRLFEVPSATFGSNVLSGDLILDIRCGSSNFYCATLSGFYMKVCPSRVRGLPEISEKKFRQAVSGIPLVKRIALSEDERRVACLSGLYPEFIYVYDNVRDRLIARIKTLENKRGKAFLCFAPDGRSVLEENKSGFAVYSVASARARLRYADPAWKGKKYLSAVWINRSQILAAVTLSDGTTRLQIVGLDGRKVWDEAIGGRWCELRRIGARRFLLETDSEIRLIDIGQKGFGG